MQALPFVMILSCACACVHVLLLHRFFCFRTRPPCAALRCAVVVLCCAGKGRTGRDAPHPNIVPIRDVFSTTEFPNSLPGLLCSALLLLLCAPRSMTVLVCLFFCVSLGSLFIFSCLPFFRSPVLFCVYTLLLLLLVMVSFIVAVCWRCDGRIFRFRFC